MLLNMRPLENEPGITLEPADHDIFVRLSDVVWDNWALQDVPEPMKGKKLELPEPNQDGDRDLNSHLTNYVFSVAGMAARVYADEYGGQSTVHQQIVDNCEPSLESTQKYLTQLESWMDEDASNVKSAKLFARLVRSTFQESQTIQHKLQVAE
jgi:hypothetical protein